jgi:hypothetical protein
MKKLIIAAVLTVASFSANALTGNEFLALPGNSQLVFTLGVIQASEAINTTMTYCTPTGVTYLQEYNIAVNLMNRAPETNHLAAAILILAALESTFPCAKQPEAKKQAYEQNF